MLKEVEIIKLIIIASAVFFYLATVFLALKKKALGNVFAIIGSALNLIVVGFNFIKNGYVPFVSMYQVLTFLSLSFMVMYLIMYFGLKIKWIGPYFTACSALVLTGVSFMEISVVWHFAPALQSVFFVPHVLCYMISYSLCTVSFLIVIINILDKTKGYKITTPTFQEREAGVYWLIRIAFPFMTSGLLLGAIWANDVWGGFWSWDAKENWALITWLFYTVYLHCYKREKLKKYTNVLAILGLIALLVTLFGVNLMQTNSLHSYS